MLYECYVILCYGILTFHFNIQICIDSLPVGFASFLVFIYWFSQAFGKSRQFQISTLILFNWKRYHPITRGFLLANLFVMSAKDF